MMSMSMWKRPKSQLGRNHDSVRNVTPPSSGDRPKNELTGLVFRIDEMEESKTPLEKRKLSRVFSSSSSPTRQLNAPPPGTPFEKSNIYDVAIVGAGPAGLVLASNLVRFGLNIIVLDNRSGGTVTGRADSLQPKTIETFRQMRLAEKLLQKGVKVHDTRFWSTDSIGTGRLRRMKRDVLFPPDLVDTIDPYLLHSHQGFLEEVLLDDLCERNLEVHRNITFVDYRIDDPSNLGSPVEVICESDITHDRLIYQARYLVGCDGASSNVRKTMPGARQTGSSSGEIWGVIDGVLDTDFPDIYSKTVVHSQDSGTILMFPRERNMTRIYVELKPEILGESQSKLELTQMFVMDRIAEILEPFNVKWKSIEWFGRYQISRKLASKFVDNDANCRVFLAGDAAHTHSPKSQGMNLGIQDACNLAWKLNFAVRGLSKPNELLVSYEEERRQVAEDLLDYDCEQIDALVGGDSDAFVENCLRNARIVSGFGGDYTPSFLNVPQKGSILGNLRVGSIPPPAKVTRLFDMNPVDIQLDVPMLGQFKVLFFTRNIHQSSEFLEQISTFALDETSSLGRATLSANLSYSLQPPCAAASDEFIRPERYTTISGLLTFGLVIRSMEMEEIEITTDLPPLFRESQYTVYLDDVPHLDTKGMTCTEKWLGSCTGSEVDMIIIRPDGYVGTVHRGLGSKEHAKKACKILGNYFDGFLKV